MSEKKNISSGAQKAQSLTRTEGGDGGQPTGSVQELGNNKPRREDGRERQSCNRRRRAERSQQDERDIAREQRKIETKAAKLEARTARRKAAAAERQAKREHRLKMAAEKRARRREKRHSPGFGGWLAAVISLGTACLVLATIVTYGWINMSAMQAGMAGAQLQSLYELNAIVDNLDSNLAKARVATSPTDRTKLLADIAIESEMAEVILERMPLEGSMTGQMAALLNKMGDSAQSMLYTVAAGGELEDWQTASLEYMYANNLKLKRALNGVIATANGSDMLAALNGKGGLIEEGFGDIENNVIEPPKGIFDGPFADGAGDVNISYFDNMDEVSAEQAEGIAAGIFADYHPNEVRCTGETTAAGLTFFNIEIATDDGGMLAQLSKKGGKLIMFDSYKECSEHNFSTERCTDIATDFLAAAGYQNVQPVWVSENGTTCNVNFCHVQDGVVVYADMIKVKVCEERGLVTGAEAFGYVKNHSSRDITGATITQAQARQAIFGRLEVVSSRLALIPLNGGEVLCYEFNGSYDGSEYFVYVDAHTGDEVQVLKVVGTAQGRAIL